MKRLIDELGEGSAFERELLTSAGADRMSPASRAAVVAATTAGTGLLAAKALTTPLSWGGRLGSMLATKWGILGLAAAGVGLGAAGVAATSRAAPRAASAVTAPDRRAPAQSRVERAGASSDPASFQVPQAEPAAASRELPSLATAETTPLPLAPPARREKVVIPSPARTPASPPASSAAPAPPGRGAETLGDQTRWIEAVRSALRDGDAPLALQRLDEFERRYPADALAEEAEVLRIEALVGTDPARARALADAYLDAHPKGTYARRVARLRARIDPPGATP